MYITDRDLEKIGITHLENLRPEKWNSLKTSQKIATLQECEKLISQFENRPEAKIKTTLFANEKPYDGVYNRKTNITTISKHRLNKGSSYDVFGTLVHESFHAYQYYALNNPGFHKNKTELQDWQQGFNSYSRKPPTDGLSNKIYRQNPLERDALNQEKSLKKALEREHELQKSQEKLEKELKELEQQKQPKDINKTHQEKSQTKNKMKVKVKTNKDLTPQQLEQLIKSHSGQISNIKSGEKIKISNRDTQGNKEVKTNSVQQKRAKPKQSEQQQKSSSTKQASQTQKREKKRQR